ncbi:hypothetical protein GYB62_00630 [bacterium]|nr:hypothetical protein [bacterium]
MSGRDASAPLAKPEPWHLEKSSGERTYVNDVVETLEQRRHAKPVKAPTASKKGRKKLIYDDFGEPLRWVWSDS